MSEISRERKLIMFPSEYYDIKKPDPDYSVEFEAVCEIPEFKIVLFDYDTFLTEGKIKLYPDNYYKGECVYRGWMLKPEQYLSLYTVLSDKGITLINSPQQYENCHLFSNYHKEIEAYTPMSICFSSVDDITADLVNRTFKRFMVKDFVKSVKGCDFPQFFKTPVNNDELKKQISKFIEHRDDLFTGGIVLKEYIDFKKYGDTTNEYRAFFLNEKLLSVCRNSKQPDICISVPIEFVMRFNTLKSNYYTVDFGELTDGSWIVIEAGDGQVSGLSPKQHVFKYYDDMRHLMI